MPPFDRFWRYNRSEEGKARNKRQDIKRRLSPVIKRLRADNERERYHRIQDNAGYYSRTRDFFPGYKLIESLETAEVVEI